MSNHFRQESDNKHHGQFHSSTVCVIVMEDSPEKYENCARRIQSYWRSFRDRRLFRLLMNTVRSAEQCPASAVLHQLSPREAQLLKDPSLKSKLRLRFAGPRFPPSVVFKIFHVGGGGRYLSGQRLFAPTDQATADSCRMMGNRAFMELISESETHREQDVICLRDFLQYSSHMDELPARLGGRGNGWRSLSLKTLSRDITLREGVTPGSRGFCGGTHLVRSDSPGQQLSLRGFLTTRRSARAQNTAARRRRLYSRTEPGPERHIPASVQTHTVLDEQMDSADNHDMQKQNGTTEKWGIKIVLPSVETEDFSDNSSESEWEEEAEKLCNWSKQLDIDALETPELS